MSEMNDIDRLAIIAAGVLAGGAASTPEDAAKLAVDCLKKLREEQRAAHKGHGGRVA